MKITRKKSTMGKFTGLPGFVSDTSNKDDE